MANKKYYQLDNKEWLLSQRQQKSRQQLSLETGIGAGSLAFAERSFTPEQRKTMVFERVHTSKLESKTGQQGA